LWVPEAQLISDIKINHINGNGWKFQELADVHQ